MGQKESFFIGYLGEVGIYYKIIDDASSRESSCRVIFRFVYYKPIKKFRVNISKMHRTFEFHVMNRSKIFR